RFRPDPVLINYRYGIGALHFIPYSPPPRPEGLSANFNTLHCYCVCVFLTRFTRSFAVEGGFEPPRSG
ncbi:MAG: hypothetical protein OEV74_04855, partial [Cyclobacteriaceae bacterium]|nr:hypothetical protein [Cyclobacteriaceae bacterium]